jgi:hypothetical protein
MKIGVSLFYKLLPIQNTRDSWQYNKPRYNDQNATQK